MNDFTPEWAAEAKARARAGWGRGRGVPDRPAAPGHVLKERDITRQIRDCLKYHGVFHWKVHQGLGSTPGVADILGCYKGRLLAIEVKAGKGRLSEAQAKFLNRVRDEGGIAIVAYSVEAVIGQLGLEMPLFGNKNPGEPG